jgi:hypothetical protein
MKSTTRILELLLLTVLISLYHILPITSPTMPNIFLKLARDWTVLSGFEKDSQSRAIHQIFGLANPNFGSVERSQEVGNW